MPFNIYLGKSEPHSNKRHAVLTLTLPGIISTKRKRYDAVFAALEKYKDRLRIILLGSPSGSEGGEAIVAQAEALALRGFFVESYRSFVSPQEFDTVMARSDFIFGDLKTAFRRCGFVETYGTTKDSGISYSMVQYSLPGIVCREFLNLSELESSTLYFEGVDGFIDVVQFLLDNPARCEELRRNAYVNSQKFSPEVIVRQLPFLNHEVVT